MTSGKKSLSVSTRGEFFSPIPCHLQTPMNKKIPIHVVAERGLIYDIEDVRRLREEFHICGTLIGILPQVPQQNVFQGLPLELMPEEIRFLVEERDAGYLVDDGKVHDLASFSFDDEDQKALTIYRKDKQEAQVLKHRQLSLLRRQQAEDKKKVKAPAKENSDSQTGTPAASSASNPISSESGTFYDIDTYSTETPVNLPSYDLFEAQYKTDKHIMLASSTKTPVNATVSLPFVKLPKQTAYDMYLHLHAKQYFLSPGFRFGGQFLAYPGDPLRYHSHHIVIGYGWEEEFNVLDVVGGGRLGTAVKKCWYVGAKEDETDEYHGFSVEWSGFG